MTEAMLLVDSRDAVLTLTINRPEQRNALRMDLLDDMAATLNRHRDDPSLRYAVITAAGDRAFAAGGDLKELDAVRNEPDALAMSQRGRGALDAIREFPLPVVGALNGLALGGGAELAMACDLRIASARAEIGFLQGQLNVTTAWGGGIDLIAGLGPERALELLLSARRIPAAEALSLGILSRVAADGQDLHDCLQEFTADWRKRSTGVMRGYKALIMARRRAIHAQLRETEQSHFAATWVHVDHWDAVERAARARARSRG